MTKHRPDIFPPAFYKARPRNPYTKSLLDLPLEHLMEMFGGEDHLFTEALEAHGGREAARDAWEAHYGLSLEDDSSSSFRLGLIAMHLQAKIDAIEAEGVSTQLN